MVEIKEVKIEHLVLDTYETGSNTCNLYFHGFPGPAGRDDIYDKTYVDNIFPKLITELDEDFYSLFYGGVCKSSGEFSFLNCFDDGLKAFNFVASKFETVNIICRSWGAVVGTYVLSKNLGRINKVTLLTPYFFIPSTSRVDQVLKEMVKSVPHILSMDNLDYYKEEIEEVRSTRSILENISNLGDKEVTVIAATEDIIIPIQVMRETSRIIKNLKYFEVIQDHNLKNHDEIKEILKKVL